MLVHAGQIAELLCIRILIMSSSAHSRFDAVASFRVAAVLLILPPRPSPARTTRSTPSPPSDPRDSRLGIDNARLRFLRPCRTRIPRLFPPFPPTHFDNSCAQPDGTRRTNTG